MDELGGEAMASWRGEVYAYFCLCGRGRGVQTNGGSLISPTWRVIRLGVASWFTLSSFWPLTDFNDSLRCWFRAGCAERERERGMGRETERETGYIDLLKVFAQHNEEKHRELGMLHEQNSQFWIWCVGYSLVVKSHANLNALFCVFFFFSF